MSRHCLISKAKLGTLTIAIFWLLTPYEVGAEATHEGRYEIVAGGSIILMKNSSNTVMTVFVTVCPTEGNATVTFITPNGNIQPILVVTAANTSCQGVSETLHPRAELDLRVESGSGVATAKGTYTVSADLARVPQPPQ